MVIHHGGLGFGRSVGSSFAASADSQTGSANGKTNSNSGNGSSSSSSYPNDFLVKNDSDFTLHPSFQWQFDDVIRLIELSYKYYKAGADSMEVKDYECSVAQKGWQVVALTENVGLVCYNSLKNLVCIVFAGSVTQADWEMNLHCRGTYVPRYNGDVHTGYLARYECVRAEMHETCCAAVELSGMVNEQTRIFAVGHCCGGSLAQLALFDLCETLGPRWFGSNFSNLATPRFFGYFIAAPLEDMMYYRT